MWANGIKKANAKEKEHRFGKVEINSRAIGKKTNSVVMGDIFLNLEIATMVNGLMENSMEEKELLSG